MKIRILMNYMIAISLIANIFSCNNSKNNDNNSDNSLRKLTISVDPKFYQQSRNKIDNPKFVIIKEDIDFMFSEPRSINYFDGKYYIIDMLTTPSVLSFNADGSPSVHFGRVGQGPGEYFRPYQFDVDQSGVYIHDGKLKKIIHFDHDGNLIAEHNIPFSIDSFKRLKNGNFLLNKSEDGESTEAVWLTDSLFNKKELLINYPEGFLGGIGTDNPFRQLSTGDISYYRIPLDTLYILSSEGKIKNKTVFSFGKKELPMAAKMDYLSFFESGPDIDYLHFRINPIMLSDSLWIAEVTGNHKVYTVLFDPSKNHSGGIPIFTSNSPKTSVFTPQGIQGVGKKGEVISCLSGELSEMTSDYNELPDSVKNTLDNGDKVLMIHSVLN